LAYYNRKAGFIHFLKEQLFMQQAQDYLLVANENFIGNYN
jgi:hypothetical protein